MSTSETLTEKFCGMCEKAKDSQITCTRLDCPVLDCPTKADHRQDFYQRQTYAATRVLPELRGQTPPSKSLSRIQSLSKHQFILILIVAVLAFLMGLYSSLEKPWTTSPPIPKPGTILYSADWSNGLNGWTGSSDWKVSQGELINDGTNSSDQAGPTIVAPYQVQGISNYAVQVTIRVLSAYACFDAATIRGSSTGMWWWTEWHGYKATICADDFFNEVAEIKAQDEEIANTGFNLDPSVHTYYLQVENTHVSLWIDSQPVLDVEDNHYLSGGEVGLKSLNTQLDVSSFEIIAL